MLNPLEWVPITQRLCWSHCESGSGFCINIRNKLHRKRKSSYLSCTSVWWSDSQQEENMEVTSLCVRLCEYRVSGFRLCFTFCILNHLCLILSFASLFIQWCLNLFCCGHTFRTVILRKAVSDKSQRYSSTFSLFVASFSPSKGRRLKIDRNLLNLSLSLSYNLGSYSFD